MLLTTRIPRPPPPCAALNMIGSSCCSANNLASFNSIIGFDVPATILTS